jgi:hypothetical protein
MGNLIILACIVPPLAIMAVAAIHGFRTASAGILSILALSGALLLGPALLEWAQKDDPVPSLRFDVANGNVVKRYAALPQRPDAIRPIERRL